MKLAPTWRRGWDSKSAIGMASWGSARRRPSWHDFPAAENAALRHFLKRGFESHQLKMPKKKETMTNCPAAFSALFLSFFPIYWEMTIPPPPARADNTKIKRNAN